MSESKLPATTAAKPASAYDDFKVQLNERANEIAQLLPSNVTKEKFLAAASAAIRQNPDLLNCSPRSLFTAITKAAQDGIYPDGREGVITPYKSEAQWNPMAAGLRKRARELDGILIDAQVVRESDHFIWEQGDTPRIVHTPAKLGTPRGDMIGVYAIFKRENGSILGREVMDREQVEMVRKQSKAPDSLMWTKFESEGWRKSVIRRGIKAVPVSENLMTIVQRDDDQFDFTAGPTPPKSQLNEFTRARDDKELGDFTAKANFAKTVPEIADIRAQAKTALPPESFVAFEEVCDNRSRQIASGPVQESNNNHGLDEGDKKECPADQSEGEDIEKPFRRGARLLQLVTAPADVPELCDSISEELKGKDLKLWRDTCEARWAELGGDGKMPKAQK